MHSRDEFTVIFFCYARFQLHSSSVALYGSFFNGIFLKTQHDALLQADENIVSVNLRNRQWISSSMKNYWTEAVLLSPRITVQLQELRWAPVTGSPAWWGLLGVERGKKVIEITVLGRPLLLPWQKCAFMLPIVLWLCPGERKKWLGTLGVQYAFIHWSIVFCLFVLISLGATIPGAPESQPAQEEKEEEKEMNQEEEEPPKPKPAPAASAPPKVQWREREERCLQWLQIISFCVCSVAPFSPRLSDRAY